jgi:hypothetical protein
VDAELQKPEFWATHYFLLIGDEENESSDLVQPIFGIEANKLYKYYESFVKPPESARMLSVGLDGGFGVGVAYVDCGESGNEMRFYITHSAPYHELLGHDSPHFALPAFRWEEVKKIHASVKDKTIAAAAALLVFPATYITVEDSESDVSSHLSQWWKDLPYVKVTNISTLVRDVIANRTVSEIKWWIDPKLGWINDGRYSFRNPKTLMCEFSETRFERMHQFLSALQTVA